MSISGRRESWSLRLTFVSATMRMVKLMPAIALEISSFVVALWMLAASMVLR